MVGELRLASNQGVCFEYHEAVVDLIVDRCQETESGARMVDAVLTHTLLPDVSREYLERLMEAGTMRRVRVEVADSEFRYVFE